jgi:LuxR family maltose regulon positive regulatory protein
MADPPVAFVAAWIGGYSGASQQECERWLDVVEAATDWQGALPDGISSLPFGAALTRAAVPFDDVGRALKSARRALELAGPEPSAFHWMAQAALGHALYLAGRPAEARPPLEALATSVHRDRQPYAVMTALAVLSLLNGDDGDDRAATSLAGRAMATAEAMGLSAEPLSGIVHMALGRALTRHGSLAQAQEQLEWSLELFAIDGMALHRAHALLLLAAARHDLGDLDGARRLLEHAHALIGQLADPGRLPSLLQQSRRMQATSHRRAPVTAPLSQRELAVLRLLPSRLSTREIGGELHVSVNTIRSQVQAVYRKLDVAGRAEAVSEARRLGLLPGSSRQRDDHFT